MSLWSPRELQLGSRPIFRAVAIPQILTLDILYKVGPADAAALLTRRRARYGHALDETLLSEWLSSSPTNRAAWDGANKESDAFNDVADEDLLSAMLESAAAVRPRG